MWASENGVGVEFSLYKGEIRSSTSGGKDNSSSSIQRFLVVEGTSADVHSKVHKWPRLSAEETIIDDMD